MENNMDPYQGVGDFQSPREILHDDIIATVTLWILDGVIIVLAIDANKNVYNGQLACRLLQVPYICMAC